MVLHTPFTGIVETVHDTSGTGIVVREVRHSIQDLSAATFVYTNDTLPKDKCPEEKLDELFQRLTVKSLSENVPEMEIKFVSGKPIGPCLKIEQPKPKQPKPTPHMTKNYPPVPRNQVDRVNATIGQLLVFKVPSVSFCYVKYLPEVESTRIVECKIPVELFIDTFCWYSNFYRGCQQM